MSFEKAMEMYPDIYSLKPDYEVEFGWWKLKWRPLWRKTFSLYRVNYFRRSFGLGFHGYFGGAHNGWGRYYDSFNARIMFLFWEYDFWIKWNYSVMAEGPGDMGFKCPLNLPGQESSSCAKGK